MLSSSSYFVWITRSVGAVMKDTQGDCLQLVKQKLFHHNAICSRKLQTYWCHLCYCVSIHLTRTLKLGNHLSALYYNVAWNHHKEVSGAFLFITPQSDRIQTHYVDRQYVTKRLRWQYVCRARLATCGKTAVF